MRCFHIFKRGIYGVYHHVSQTHLKRYLGEFDFRYNYRTALGARHDRVKRASSANVSPIGGLVSGRTRRFADYVTDLPPHLTHFPNQRETHFRFGKIDAARRGAALRRLKSCSSRDRGDRRHRGCCPDRRRQAAEMMDGSVANAPKTGAKPAQDAEGPHRAMRPT